MYSAVNEDTEGALQSYTVLPGGVLSGPVDTVSSGGDSPAFTTPLSTGQVAIVNVSFLTCLVSTEA